MKPKQINTCKKRKKQLKLEFQLVLIWDICLTPFQIPNSFFLLKCSMGKIKTGPKLKSGLKTSEDRYPAQWKVSSLN